MKAGRAAQGRLAAFFLGVWMLAACTGTARAASGFADVNAGAYYAAAVDWAVPAGITTGTSTTAFSPERTCTQAEILTFLWRANGLPDPVIENPFENVDPGSYYYKAAVWAYENQMISGSMFDADRPCTRAAAVRYLWNAAGNPASARGLPFTDVPANADYREAVAWALERQITNGSGSTSTFAPDSTCTRAEIVTFLYRARDVWANTSGETNGQEDTAMPKLNITVNGQSFTGALEDTPTARAFLELLPMTVDMSELNGNEKFYYLPSGLPTNASRPGNIHAGDLMLFGSDCLVLFYESFSSSYSYTRLGSVDNPSGLAAVLGHGSVEVTFQAG